MYPWKTYAETGTKNSAFNANAVAYGALNCQVEVVGPIKTFVPCGTPQ